MILVTGGTGLVGSYVLLQLTRKKRQVRALIRGNSPKKEVYDLFRLYEPREYQRLYDSIQWTEGDILDIFSLEQAFAGISQVYHIAGKVSFEEREARQLYKINVEGTKNIVNISIEKAIEKFCFISSIATLDLQLNQSVITEKSEWNFKAVHSSYAYSKYGAEMEVWRGSQEGLKVVVVHPGVVLGSGNWERSSGLLYDLTVRNRAFYPSGTTGYVDAEDVAEICTRLMDDDSIVNERYILISENVSYERTIQFLRKIFNKAPAKKIPDSWLEKIAFLSRIFPVNRKISKAVTYTLKGKSEYSGDKVKEVLEYTFIPVEESLKFHANNYLRYKQIKND
ncbi:MAG: NAD-dependent epimerase/dehydratase family protein [Flavobacteriaceae bacterium]|jgi:nucleoside-diphosphate-sugar epimerase|nr:NAD-dependent epimerase/dehydratase family protein [Flavobacteriaceae bacterium]